MQMSPFTAAQWREARRLMLKTLKAARREHPKVRVMIEEEFSLKVWTLSTLFEIAAGQAARGEPLDLPDAVRPGVSDLNWPRTPRRKRKGEVTEGCQLISQTEARRIAEGEQKS